jgi:hypothetical protein
MAMRTVKRRTFMANSRYLRETIRIPSKLIDFITNPDNALEAHDLGLLDLDKASLDALTADEPASPSPDSKKPDLEPDKAPEPKAKPQLPT